MTRTKESTVYTFDELSDHAKDRARGWMRTCIGDDFNNWSAGDVIDDAARMADMIGLDIRTRQVRLLGGGTRYEPHVFYSGFGSQGDGASFVGSYHYKRGSVRAVATEAPIGEDKTHRGNNELNRITRALAEVQRRHFYQLQALVSAGRSHYSHSSTMDIDVERADERTVPPDDVETMRELMRDFADWIYRQLEREYEYRMSDEVIDEDIRANEYEFDVDGNQE